MKASYRDFLPAVIEVQETPPSPLGRIIMWVVMILMLLAVSWASLSEVDIVAVTRGKLAVSRLSRPVHTAVTAEIAEVLVEDGQWVTKGQPLIRLNNSGLLAQREENLLRQHINQLHIARLSQLNQYYQESSIEPTLPLDLLEQESVLSQPIQVQLLAEVESFRQDKLLYQNAQRMLQVQLEAYRQQLKMSQELLPIYRQQYEALLSLYKRKMTSNDSVLEQRKVFLEASYNVDSMLSKVREAEVNHQQKIIELEASVAEKIRLAEQQRVERLNENILLATQLKQLDALLLQYTLTSPVNGWVESLVYRDTGAAVEAPQELLKVVPDGEKLSAEVWVSNQDVGFLSLGQNVTVKIDAFDFTRYGWIEGKLKYLSLDAIDDPNLGLVYRAVIELVNDNLLINGIIKTLEPGMSITAEIKTGKRTILSYLLSPMLEALDDVGKQR